MCRIDMRVDMNMNLDHMHDMFKQIAKNVYGLKMDEVKTFDQFSIIFPSPSSKVRDQNTLPHVDYPLEMIQEDGLD